MNEVYFSQIREDSQVERHLLQTHQLRKITCIGSGGCTAFSLLNDSAEAVFAVDVNRAQCALIELKKAAIRQLDLAAYLGFIGEASMPNRVELYQNLRPELAGFVRNFWDRRTLKVAHGINCSGVTDRFYRFVGGNLRKNVCGEGVAQKLFDCSSLEEQRAFYEEYFTNDAWKTAMRVLFSKTTQTQFYPPFWFAHTDEGEFEEFFSDQFTNEVLSKPISNNYFLSQLMLGSYIYNQPEGTPHYLSPEGFASAKRNLHKLSVVNEPMQKFLARSQDIDAFFLSNVFDWGKQSDQQSIGQAVITAMSHGAIMLYRNMYSPAALAPPLADRFEPDQELSELLLSKERSMLYRHLTAGVLH